MEERYEKNKDQEVLKKALARRQQVPLSSNFSYRMMERVHVEATKQQKKQSILSWSLLLFAVLFLIGLGAYVLFFYLDLSLMSSVTRVNIRQHAPLFEFYVYIALLALGLLAIDYWLRKAFFWK